MRSFTFPFLLVSLALLLWAGPAPRAEAKGIAGQPIHASQNRRGQSRKGLKLESLHFYYKLDEAARFLELKNQWQSEHRGEVPLSQAVKLAVEANTASDMDTPFSRWRYHGGPAPVIFTAQAHVYCTGTRAMLHVPFQVRVRAKVGNWRVDPILQLTDYESLESSVRWEVLSQQTVKVPAIAAGEDVLLPLMDFQLLRFLQKHPNQFPVAVEVRLSNPSLGTVTTTLPLTPDHFMIPLND